jgi:hypothetical protein
VQLRPFARQYWRSRFPCARLLSCPHSAHTTWRRRRMRYLTSFPDALTRLLQVYHLSGKPLQHFHRIFAVDRR